MPTYHVCDFNALSFVLGWIADHWLIWYVTLFLTLYIVVGGLGALGTVVGSVLGVFKRNAKKE